MSLKLFLIVIAISFVISSEQYSIFNLPNKPLEKNIIIDKVDFNKEIEHIVKIQEKAKRISCMAIVNNSLKNKSSKIQSIIKTSSLSTDEVVDAIIDNCSHKISDALASKILTPNEITKEIEENEEYDKLISFDAKNTKQQKKQTETKNLIQSQLITICFFITAIILLLAVLYIKNRGKVEQRKKK